MHISDTTVTAVGPLQQVLYAAANSRRSFARDSSTILGVLACLSLAFGSARSLFINTIVGPGTAQLLLMRVMAHICIPPTPLSSLWSALPLNHYGTFPGQAGNSHSARCMWLG